MSLLEVLTFDEPPPGIERFEWGPAAADRVEERMRRDGAHDRGHLARVLGNARRIARAERRSGREVDWEVLAAACLFHDAVNPPKDSDRRDRAAVESARFADEFFRTGDWLAENRRRRLRSAIREHSFSRGEEPGTIESAILQDADRLEAVGAVGVARCFAVAGTMGSAIAHPTDPFGRERPLDDEAFAVDHFFEKLLELRETLRTDAGREIAADRHAFLVEFLDQFADEVGADPPARESIDGDD